MTKPIELLLEKLEEISDVIKRAYRNDLDKENIEELVEIYNQYFYAIQLIQSHSEIKYKFSRFIPYNNGKVTNRYCWVTKHMEVIEKRTYKKQTK